MLIVDSALLVDDPQQQGMLSLAIVFWVPIRSTRKLITIDAICWGCGLQNVRLPRLISAR